MEVDFPVSLKSETLSSMAFSKNCADLVLFLAQKTKPNELKSLSFGIN